METVVCLFVCFGMRYISYNLKVANKYELSYGVSNNFIDSIIIATHRERSQQTHTSLYFSSFNQNSSSSTYLLEREVGTTVVVEAMGANPFAVTAEKTNSKAVLSFIIIIIYFVVVSLN